MLFDSPSLPYIAPMYNHALRLNIISRDPNSHARLGKVHTPHGSFDTPAFMPVGTLASVKGLLPAQVEQTGSQILLANTYHLMLRPGSELVAEMGGLHQWMRWDKPILTDSGGFQVFSLGDTNKITDEGVTFKSHLNGATIELTPERSILVQNELGADIIMAFDDCPPARPPQNESDQAASADLKAHRKLVQAACERSVRWLDRCVKAHQRPEDQALFGIVQGGVDLDQRTWCVQQTASHDLPGFAIGGVAVGEGYEGLKMVVEHTAPLLPDAKPRYLMGVGYEQDILTAVQAGIDMFDCVLPTRNGRNANAFTPTGQMRLRNAGYARDMSVIDPTCDCVACGGGFTRSYLRHLFVTGEMLGPVLVSAHNIRHFQRYMLDIRRAIAENDWSLITRNWPVCTGRAARAPGAS